MLQAPFCDMLYLPPVAFCYFLPYYAEQALDGHRHNMPRPSPPSVSAETPRAAKPTAPADGNVAVGSHTQYVPTLTAAVA